MKFDVLRRAFKKRDFFKKVFCWFLIKIGFSNKNLQALEIRNKKFLRLSKKYKRVLDNINFEPSIEKISNYVWFFWWQGLDMAPLIVKKCFSSIQKNMKNKEIIVIDKNNYFEYANIPEYIIKKVNSGIISLAHFSDILRLDLLINHGGTWIDSTTYFTGEIPEYLYSKPLCLLTHFGENDVTISYNNWFIISQKDNRVLKTVRELLYIFWQKNNNLSEYFLFHLYLTMVLDKYKDDNNNIIPYSDIIPELLRTKWNETYSKEYMEYFNSISHFHKLTYKYKEKDVVQDSILEHILNN